MRWLHGMATLLRLAGARLRSRGRDPSAIAAFAASGPEATFTILGAGASVNDLTPADIARIEAGTTASINMAALLPIRLDIVSLELVASQGQFDAIDAALARQAGDFVIWFQDRKKHRNGFSRALAERYPFFAYRRASVSTGRSLDIYRAQFRRIIAPQVFAPNPDLRVSFALTGSVARLVLLGCSLGYRRFGFAGVDLGATPYFWQEEAWAAHPDRWRDDSPVWTSGATVAHYLSPAAPVPNVPDFLRILREDSPVPLEFFTIDPKGRSRLTGTFAGWPSLPPRAPA